MNALLLEGKNKKMKDSNLVFEEIIVKDYEKVLKVTDKKTGLLSIISLHNTKLGMGLGGTRIYPYPSFDQALEDVLRLAKGMTYKSAIAKVGFGGAKSVIIADPKKEKNEALLLSFGKAVDSLEGAYICAEDVGCTTKDVMVIRRATPYVTGLAHEKGSGDPGRFTAWGVLRGIQASLKKLYGTDSLQGKKIVVQGLGNVGAPLVDYLFWLGARLVLCDIDEKKAKAFAFKYGAEWVSAEKVEEIPCDILSPCALGGSINDKSIGKFHCKAIAGCANNQLWREEHADELRKRNILYAPDFVINAGGLINVSAELQKGGYVPPQEQCHKIYDVLLAIFEISEKKNISTHRAAVMLAEEHIALGIGKRLEPPCFISIA